MRAAEAAAIAGGWSEEQLIDMAGTRLAHALNAFFPHPGTLVAYLGKGHNAADTLVALRILRDRHGWKIAARCAHGNSELAPLTREKWRQSGINSPLQGLPPWPEMNHPLVLLDGLVGIGARGDLGGKLPALAAEMEWLRHHAGARVAAVDLPSGVDPDSGAHGPGAVIADVTFMIAHPKAGLLTSSATDAVGALALVPVEPLATSETAGDLRMICPQEMSFGKSPRPFEFHKGMAGRVTVIAGSTPYPGAAALTAIGALRGGAGLVTLLVPEQAAAAISSRCPPEIIIRTFTSCPPADPPECDALAIGCGLGRPDPAVTRRLLDWLDHSATPAVIDADALNLIASEGRMAIFKNHHILTPHPGEFARLAPDLHGLPREAAALAFARRCPSTLLLKGARTLIAQSHTPLWCNSTGSPGMATGGQGDLLAGVIAARLASGMPPPEAAAHAAWLCGRAAECALENPDLSVESLTPSDTARHLGRAFLDWKCARR